MQSNGKGLQLSLSQPAPVSLGQGVPTAYQQNRILFGAETDNVTFPARWLQKKPYGDEQVVREHFQRHIQLLEQRYPNNLQGQIREIVCNLLPSGECCIERVATTLDLHPRVLQKRLQQQHTSFSALLQETRRQIALQHLRSKTLSITDLALNLGYAEVSIFSRNFKSWTGKSPRQWKHDNSDQGY